VVQVVLFRLVVLQDRVDQAVREDLYLQMDLYRQLHQQGRVAQVGPWLLVLLVHPLFQAFQLVLLDLVVLVVL